MNNKDDAKATTKDQDMDGPCPPHLLEKKMWGVFLDHSCNHDCEITPFILMKVTSKLGWDIPTIGH